MNEVSQLKDVLNEVSPILLCTCSVDVHTQSFAPFIAGHSVAEVWSQGSTTIRGYSGSHLLVASQNAVTVVHLRHRSPLVLVILMDCSSSVSHSNLLIAANEPFYDQSCELLERHPELGERRSYPLILGRGRLVLSRPFGNSGRTIMELGLNQTDRTKTMLSIRESIYHWRSLRRQYFYDVDLCVREVCTKRKRKAMHGCLGSAVAKNARLGNYCKTRCHRYEEGGASVVLRVTYEFLSSLRGRKQARRTLSFRKCGRKRMISLASET